VVIVIILKLVSCLLKLQQIELWHGQLELDIVLLALICTEMLVL